LTYDCTCRNTGNMRCKRCVSCTIRIAVAGGNVERSGRAVAFTLQRSRRKGAPTRWVGRAGRGDRNPSVAHTAQRRDIDGPVSQRVRRRNALICGAWAECLDNYFDDAARCRRALAGQRPSHTNCASGCATRRYRNAYDGGDGDRASQHELHTGCAKRSLNRNSQGNFATLFPNYGPLASVT